MKKIAILGSTGSIGTQTLDVIEKNPHKFKVKLLTANNNVKLLIEQAKRFIPEIVVIKNENHYQLLKNELKSLPIKVLAGQKAIENAVEEEYDILLTALVGYAGLIPTYKAIKKGRNIALANKETLVVAGELITQIAKEKQVKIIPVDSEHSAIFQCLVGERKENIEKIYLTASGGPFRGWKKHELEKVSVKQALKHPNWSMGAKITIDSATMMNKGLEAIEAKWLFDLEPKQIDIIVHPQSIIHSIVQFIDGSMKAQMGLPDMRFPIAYALSYPERLQTDLKRFDFLNYPSLTFEKPDFEVFESLKLAFYALEKGGNIPCILNAANEIAVDAFLNEKIKFTDIPKIIEKVLEKIPYSKNLSLEDYIKTDELSRKLAQEIIKKFFI